jgi:hypothetical protein
VEYDLFLFSDTFSCELGSGGWEAESFLIRGKLGEQLVSSLGGASR